MEAVYRIVADDGSQQRKPNFKTAVEDVKALATMVAMEAESVLGRRTARVLGVLVLFAVVVGALLALLNWYIAPTGAAQKKDVVATLAQILGGAALLSGLYFTWRTLQVNREGQITERFTRAIDQLGKVEDGQKLFEIRIGGIYALERIARESKEDYWPIMEILTAYVRQHAPWPEEEWKALEAGAVEKKSKEDSRGESEPAESPPSPDIKAIMTVLRRRTGSYGHGEPARLDLSETNLSKTDLYSVNFSGAWLRRSNLSGASLWGANLSGANLKKANLKGAFLMDVNLFGADLSGADLTEASYLARAQLENTTGDENTKLPSDHKPPAHWGVNPGEQPEGD